MREIHGVDFSGARRAGRKIWIASGQTDGERLVIQRLVRAADLPDSKSERDVALRALRRFIAERPGDAFGLDFPFALADEMIEERTWKAFALAFGARYRSPEAFRARCRKAGKPERKRVTDIDAKTPFSPYHLWLHRQTFYGIRDVLAPLVRDGLACVLPMQKARAGRAWILEICPASTLKKLSEELGKKLYIPYKGRGAERREARKCILGTLECCTQLHVCDDHLRETIIADPEGDALDSVVAALGVDRALRHCAFPRQDWQPVFAREGYVYA